MKRDAYARIHLWTVPRAECCSSGVTGQLYIKHTWHWIQRHFEAAALAQPRIRHQDHNIAQSQLVASSGSIVSSYVAGSACEAERQLMLSLRQFASITGRGWAEHKTFSDVGKVHLQALDSADCLRSHPPLSWAARFKARKALRPGFGPVRLRGGPEAQSTTS